jgi:hypothetical protein
MAAYTGQHTRQIPDREIDSEQLEKVRKLLHVEEKEERPPMDEIFHGEKIIGKKYDAGFMNTIGHELNHLFVAYQLGIPMNATTLTALPEGDTLGKVTLPDHVDYSTLQIVAAAGSIPAHDGKARGYGSDLYKAKLIEIFGMGTTVAEAQRKAASLINFYDSDVRMMCAKIIAYLQTEKNMSHIPGEMLAQIEQRARYELKQNKVRVKSETFFKAPPPEEEADKKTVEATIGRPPDKRTEIVFMQKNVCLINLLTDDIVESSTQACSVCFYPLPGHSADCAIKKQASQSSENGETSELPKSGTKTD